MDYQGNSNKDKRVSEKIAVPAREPKEKVVTGSVIVKEKGLGTRFKGIFFGGDFDTAARYVAAEVLLPALRNLLVDVVSKGADRLIYGDSGPRRRGAITTSYTPRVQYNNPAARTAYLPDQAPIRKWEERGTKSAAGWIVSSKADADLIAERVVDIVDSYEVVSLADVLEMLGLPSTPIDNKWGWARLPNIDIKQVREGWEISFPPMEEL